MKETKPWVQPPSPVPTVTQLALWLATSKSPDNPYEWPHHAVVLPGGDDNPYAGEERPPLSSCFHLDSLGRACFSAAGAKLAFSPRLPVSALSCVLRH